MNYDKERIEKDLYDCAINHYTIEKISYENASVEVGIPLKKGNY